MLWNSRPIVSSFEGGEILYLRYRKEHFVEGQLNVAAIRFPKTSVNRGALSEPEDVLFSKDGKFNGLGVVEFCVADIPEVITQDQGPAYRFFMQHVPIEDNYSHSEIWSDHIPETGNYRLPSKTVKLAFRVRLCQRIQQEKIRIEAVR